MRLTWLIAAALLLMPALAAAERIKPHGLEPGG
jgi:hypothetical protein